MPECIEHITCYHTHELHYQAWWFAPASYLTFRFPSLEAWCGPLALVPGLPQKHLKSGKVIDWVLVLCSRRVSSESEGLVPGPQSRGSTLCCNFGGKRQQHKNRLAAPCYSEGERNANFSKPFPASTYQMFPTRTEGDWKGLYHAGSSPVFLGCRGEAWPDRRPPQLKGATFLFEERMMAGPYNSAEDSHYVPIPNPSKPG